MENIFTKSSFLRIFKLVGISNLRLHLSLNYRFIFNTSYLQNNKINIISK